MISRRPIAGSNLKLDPPRHRDHQVVAVADNRRRNAVADPRLPHTVACSPVGTSVTFCATMLRRSTGRHGGLRQPARLASPARSIGTAGRRELHRSLIVADQTALLGNHTPRLGPNGAALRATIDERTATARNHYCDNKIPRTSSRAAQSQK